MLSLPKRYRSPAEVPLDFTTPNHPLLRWMAKTEFDSKKRERLYRRLADPLRAGHSAEEAIGMLYRRERAKGWRRPETVVLRSIYYRLKAGGDVTGGMAEFVPMREQLSIRAGEINGNLAEAFLGAGQAIRAVREMKAAQLVAAIIPLFITIMIFVGLYMAGAFLLPTLARSIDMSTVTGLATLVVVLGNYAVSIWFPITIAVLVAIVFTVIASYSRWSTRLRAVADRTPFYSFYRLMLASGWLTTLSAMLNAGNGVNESLKQLHVIATEQNNRYLASRTLAIIEANKGGASNIGFAMEAGGHGFPDNELIGDIVMRSTLPNFEYQLGVLSLSWVEEKVKEVKRVSTIMSWVGLFIMTGAMAVFMLSLYSLFSQFQTSVGGM